MEQLINAAFECVIKNSAKYAIDESHALKHSMEVYKFAQEIYESELDANPYLKGQMRVIFASAILHDMCDKKYMDEADGLRDIKDNMSFVLTAEELVAVEQIITTMSYSKVKCHGYPKLGKYQLAFHIVREADLLAAYDVDRCIIFGMMVDKMVYSEALDRATKLFNHRVLKYIDDGLFITAYSIHKSFELHNKALL
jgi:HD superfamily phosphodiesterase